MNKQIKSPTELLLEIEAYLSFRLCNLESPSVPEEDMRGIKLSIKECLKFNESKISA